MVAVMKWLNPELRFVAVPLILYQSCGEEGDVKYVFMLAIPGNQSADQYMRVLATLAGLLAKEEFVDQLDSVHSYDEMLALMKACS